MRLISSTLLTVALFALFVVAPDPVVETPPVTTTTPGTTSSTSDKPATTPAKQDTPAATPIAPGKPPTPVTTPTKKTTPSDTNKVVGSAKEGEVCPLWSTSTEDKCAADLKCDTGNDFADFMTAGYCVKNARNNLGLGDFCVARGCKSGLVCKAEPIQPPPKPHRRIRQKGKCSEKSKLGEACARDYECTNHSCIGGKCAPKRKKDEECPDYNDCERGLYCLKASKDKAGKCLERKPINSQCARSDECAEGTCRHNGGTDGLCLSHSYKAKMDGICFTYSDCEEELYCALTEQKKRGKCAARLAEGAQCAGHKVCMDSLYCVTAGAGQPGKCTKRRTDGQSCTSTHDCLKDSFCRSAGIDGICVSKKDEYKKQDAGAVCISHLECKPELYCSQLKPRKLGKCTLRKAKDECCKTGHGMCAAGLHCKGPVDKNPRDTDGKCDTKPDAKKKSPPKPTTDTKPTTETKPTTDTTPVVETKPVTEPKPTTQAKPRKWQ